MKWTNRGHELDEIAAKYAAVKNIYIWGAGAAGIKVYNFLRWFGLEGRFNIEFFDAALYGRRLMGGVVRPAADLPGKIGGNPAEAAVVLAFGGGVDEARRRLNAAGVDNVFFAHFKLTGRHNFIQNFICVLAMYESGRLLSHWTNYAVTTKCNLNCIGCLNFTNYVERPAHDTLEDFMAHTATVFSRFDALYSLHFTGGEPFLNQELPLFLDYIAENYRDRIFEFFVITNGSVVPGDELCAALKRADAYVSIDDYSANVPQCAKMIDKVICKLEDAGVETVVAKTGAWYDIDVFGGDYPDLSAARLIEHKDTCQSFLHDFYGGAIWACCYQHFAAKAGIVDFGSEYNEYLNIELTDKMEILEYRQGYTQSGHVDFCRRCKGLGGARAIPCAVQYGKA